MTLGNISTAKMTKRKTPEEQLIELEERQAQINARIQKKKAEVRKTERKKETRRKIIAGALALEHAAINPEFGAELKKLISRHAREDDKALFDL